MDFKKTITPIHIRCVKCGHDISFNGRKIDRDIENLKREIDIIETQIGVYGIEIKDNPDKEDNKWLASVTRALGAKRYQLSKLKELRKNSMEEIERQKFKIFKTLVKTEIGEGKFIQLMKETEDDLQYNDYDTAIQRHNNFSNV